MNISRHNDQHRHSLQIIGLLLYLAGLFLIPVASAAQTMNFSYVTGEFCSATLI